MLETDNFAFAENVFNDKVMKQCLPKGTYNAVKNASSKGTQISMKDAKILAEAMKKWALEKGATHFTHWFQPMTGITAEKHNSFVEPDGNDNIILKFSEKSLVKGESDASSLPSGGLRATFEARGYTAWDPTSYAFVKDGSLYIPTAFCSYGGEALDKKTPLLRSVEALNIEALRILRLFGNTKAKKVTPSVGAEQEYFLIDKSVYEKRIDLINCGRTLFGAKPPKGQELEDHYYGAIKERVAGFMKDLDKELWKLGVCAKTKHNEVAPAQHELASVYTSVNIACDQNQLTMQVMKSVANKHDLVCLLAEKPFANINGSGKHDNWSLSTDLGENLLEPGETPELNAQFLIFLLAVIKGVYDYQDLLRISVASAGNDHRLGSNEAPPAILSIYLGEELDAVLDAISKGVSYKGTKKEKLKIGVSVLPQIPKDSTDRNRTSPLAFTGNKFEFRMVGASQNIACPNFILNTIVAEELKQFADILEKSTKFNEDLNTLIKKVIKESSPILFSGNSYSKEWEEEAKKRGLLNLTTTVDALPHYFDEKNIKLFESHKVLSKGEIYSRAEILLENYANIIHIEALTAIDMTRKQIIPAVIKYENFLAKTIKHKLEIDSKMAHGLESRYLKQISKDAETLGKKLDILSSCLDEYTKLSDANSKALYCKNNIIPAMDNLRKIADTLETMLGKDFLPYPSYEDILYSVKY